MLQVIGDRGDLFGVFPGGGEQGQLTLERATLRLFVHRHLEGESLGRIEAKRPEVPIRV